MFIVCSTKKIEDNQNGQLQSGNYTEGDAIRAAIAKAADAGKLVIGHYS